MQAEGVEVAPSWSTPAGFHSRAAAVFGSLADSSTTGAAPTWSLQQEQVFRPGKGADYSSEEEEEDAKETERRRTELLPNGMLELDGGDADEDFQPSAAFCRALDREDDYDDNDAIAMGATARGLGPEDEAGEARPAAGTEVLDDNVYAQRIQRQQQAAASAKDPAPAAEPMEVEPVQIMPARDQHPAEHAPAEGQVAAAGQQGSSSVEQPTPAPSSAERRAASTTPKPALKATAANGSRDGSAAAAGGGAADDDEAKRSKKKVRFAGPYVPPQQRQGESGEGPEGRAPPMPPGSPAAAAPAQQPGQRRQRGPGLSYVPDHVKNPHKYTCYVLEQPLVVGGGEQGGAGADGGRAEMERAQRAAQAAAAASSGTEDVGAPAAELPAFGSGIEFRPSARSQSGGREGAAAGRSAAAAAGAAAAERAKAGSVGLQVVGEIAEGAEEEEEMQEQEATGAEGGPGTGAAAAVVGAKPAKKARNFRSKGGG